MFNRKLHSSDGSASPRTRQPLIRHFPFQAQHLVMLHIAQLVLWQPKNMMTRLEVNYAVSEKGVGCDVDRDDSWVTRLTEQQGLQDNGLYCGLHRAAMDCTGLY